MTKGLVAFFISTSFAVSAVSAANLVEQNLDYTDHLRELHNPARGTTHHKVFYLRPGKALDLKTNGTVYNDFMRFLVDLGGFSSKAWTYEGEGDALGNNLTAKKATLVLKPADSAVETVSARNAVAATAVIELPLEMDPTKILSKKWKLKSETPMQDWTGANFGDILEDELEFDGVTEFDLKVLLPDSVKTGKWNAYLRISHYGDMKTDKNFHVIQFANDSSYFDNVIGGNFVGSFVVDEHVQAIGNNVRVVGASVEGVKNCGRFAGRLVSNVRGDFASSAALNGSFHVGEIYDIHGKRMNGLNLRPGVYVVR